MGQTDAGGGKKKKMKERARRKGRKEGRKEGGVAICLLGPGIGFGFRSPAGRTDGGWRACGGASGPAARRAAAAAIIERGIHAFLPRCTPTSTPTYGRCRLFCPAAAVITSTRVAGGRTVVLLLRRPTDRAAPKGAALVQFATSCTVELAIQRRAWRGGGDGQRGSSGKRWPTCRW